MNTRYIMHATRPGLRFDLLAGTVKKPLGYELRAIQSEAVPPPSIYRDSGKEHRAPPDQERWLRGMTGFTATGRLKSLCRIATIAGHLEVLDPIRYKEQLGTPAVKKSSSHHRTVGPVLGPLSVQLKKSIKTLVFIENLMASHALHEMFQIVDRQRLTFANIFDAFMKDDLSLVVRQDALPLPPNSAVIPFLLLILYVKLVTKTTGHSDVTGLFTLLRKKVFASFPIICWLSLILVALVTPIRSPNSR